MKKGERIIAITAILIIMSGIALAYWQRHQDKDFNKMVECQKLGKEFYYNPESNECVDGSYCASNPDKYWCR